MLWQRAITQNVSLQIFLAVVNGQVQNTGHSSFFYQYGKNPKHSLKLSLGLILDLNKSF